MAIASHKRAIAISVFLLPSVRLLLEGPRCCQGGVRFSNAFFLAAATGSTRRDESLVGLWKALRELPRDVERSVATSAPCERVEGSLCFGMGSEFVSELNPRRWG